MPPYLQPALFEHVPGIVAGFSTRQGGVSPEPYAPLPATADVLPSHQWLIEFERMPASLDAFAEVIDAYLQAVNRHYQIRREARAFGRPEIVPLPQGTFYTWLKQTKERVGGQTKVPRMSEERKVADGVLALAGNNGP